MPFGIVRRVWIGNRRMAPDSIPILSLFWPSYKEDTRARGAVESEQVKATAKIPDAA